MPTGQHDTGFPGVGRAIRSLLRHGWRVLTEVHTVVWIVTDLLGIAVVPIALGVWVWIQGVHLSIVIAIATMVLGVSFLCLLGLLGYRDEQRRLGHASPHPVTPQLPISQQIKAHSASDRNYGLTADHPATKEADTKERMFVGEGVTSDFLRGFFEHHTAAQATNAQMRPKTTSVNG
jgi:hypothetical protein